MSRYVPNKALLALIKQHAMTVGMMSARDTCKHFLLSKRNPGVEPTDSKPVPKKWTVRAYIRQRFACARCRGPLDPHIKSPDPESMEGDHRVPLEKGGRHHPSNIDAMHKRCNASKGAKDQFEESKASGRTIMEQESYSRSEIEDAEV